MAIDPRQLKPGELARLLNSTPLGEVISERQLHRHRTRAGFRVAADGDAGKVDLFRYVAWLVTTRHEALAEAVRTPGNGVGLTGYEAMKERARLRNAMLSRSGRDIGDLPPVADSARRARAATDFRYFCETYFGQTFHLKWSDDHLKVIAKIEQAVLEGGLFAMAMPRGSGKTSLCEEACLWALLYGHREFVALIGSDEEHAAGMLESIKAELENSEILGDDFPEVCHPIRSLEGIHQRASGQLYQGKQTHIGWTSREIVLPTMHGSAASGSIIRVAGITGRIRGMKHKRIDGVSVRPSLVLIDDPQTDDSARSASQCAYRERIIKGAILGMAGPGKKITGLAAVTVIRKGDVADRLLDRQAHPEWHGERTKTIYAMPTHLDLWEKYRELMHEGERGGVGLKLATEFYRENQARMDEGARVAWSERFNHDEISGLQNAMTMYYRDTPVFHAEYQNDPLDEQLVDGTTEITGVAVLDELRLSRLPRKRVPIPASHITAFIDVQSRCHYYLVLAVADDFTAWIVDYGNEPEQGVTHFTHRDCPKPLSEAYASAGEEGKIYRSLRALMTRLGSTSWRREDGIEMSLERCLVDANWGKMTAVVYQALRESGFPSVFMPSHGMGIGAGRKPMALYRREPGERKGLNWIMPLAEGKRSIRHVNYDTHFWKSFAATRIASAVGDPGCLRLYGDSIARHKLLSEHFTAERAVRTEGHGRAVDEWTVRRPGIDNHWWDCLVGAYVAASMVGCELRTGETNNEPKARARRKITLRELQERRKGHGAR